MNGPQPFRQPRFHSLSDDTPPRTFTQRTGTQRTAMRAPDLRFPVRSAPEGCIGFAGEVCGSHNSAATRYLAAAWCEWRQLCAAHKNGPAGAHVLRHSFKTKPACHHCDRTTCLPSLCFLNQPRVHYWPGEDSDKRKVSDASRTACRNLCSPRPQAAARRAAARALRKAGGRPAALAIPFGRRECYAERARTAVLRPARPVPEKRPYR